MTHARSASGAAELQPDERDDLAAGCHYEREAPAGSEPTCICGAPWICPEWWRDDV